MRGGYLKEEAQVAMQAVLDFPRGPVAARIVSLPALGLGERRMAKRASGDRLDGLSSRDLKEVELARIQAAKEVKLSRHFAFIRVAPNLERLGVGGLIVWSLSLLPKIPIEWSPTIENLVKEWLAPVGFGIGGLCLCVTAIVLRRAGRRRASIEHTQTVALETELDAKRSSSQMPPTGTTREGD